MIQNVNLLQSFISINSSLVYENRYYRQVFLDNCAYKMVSKQMTAYLDFNLLKTDKYQIL